ncbi:MAG: M14 family zinc carboxypeptidase [Gemmatimonadota bacterium]|nr:M14 family zinc carboxypeptidase [Gemmatimonadota bacterium]
MRTGIEKITFMSLALAAGLFALPGFAYSAEVPEFYKTTVEDVESVIRSVKKGSVRLEAVSPGGRPVYSVSYGEMDPYERTANFQSAALSHSPEAFARKAPGAKPVFMVVSGVHGHEFETVVGALNLIRIMETGRDFRGRAWPELAEKAARYRVVIMPCCNPDGRARVPKNSFVGLPADTMTYYGQGTRADGTMYRWPFVKEYQPMVADIGFLGGYHNDQGVNIQCDDMFFPLAEETKAILRLAKLEAPDCVVNLHSHEPRGEFLISDFVPPAMKARNKEIADRYLEVMEKEGVPACTFKRSGDRPATWALDLTDALYHVSGALSMTFEGPHGCSDAPEFEIGYEGILDTHLIMYREMIRIGLEPGGFRGKEGVPRGNWKE